MGLEQEMELVNGIVLSEEDEADIDRALLTARDPEDEAVALSARFDVPNRMLLLELKTGQRLAIPQEDIQDLHRANPEDLVELEIVGPGTALHFERVMEGVKVDWLRRGIYGTDRWMEGLAQRRRERLQKAS